VTDAAGNDEELAWMHRHRAAVRFGSADAEQTTQDKEHLVLVFMAVPGELPQHLRHLDVLIVDLTNHARRPKFLKSGTRKFQRDRVLLGLLGCLLFEFGLRRASFDSERFAAAISRGNRR
jgi:hypothetical protein